MIDDLRARWAIIAVVLLVSIAYLVPNFAKFGPDDWWFSKRKLVMGLDIQGGIHLVMGVDTDGVLRLNTRNLAATLPAELKREDVTATVTVVDETRGLLKITAGTKAELDKVVSTIERLYPQVLQVVGQSGADNSVEMRYYEIFVRDFRKQVVSRTIETIRNRIDEFGVAEPSISAQGNDRIQIQLPGIQDAQQAKELINRTARLDFMIVKRDVAPEQLQAMISEAEKTGNYSLGKDGLRYGAYIERLNADLKTKLPADSKILFEKSEGAPNLETGKIPYVVSTTDLSSGADLQDAVATLDPSNGSPMVSFTFNADGARHFGEMTTKFVNNQMAIVLDNVIQSAPNIREPITQGRGQIEMGGSGREKGLEEAQMISMALRSGALPASMEQLEERTVGPTVGEDAIQAGAVGGYVGGLIVIIFMIAYYRAFGVIASLGIAVNLLITLAMLTALGATLTLPGVAGIALTVGMAVDANIIINERIKDELMAGSSYLAAIRAGYDKAFWAIFDGNIVVVAVCIILMYFGTGPIRGFAVTLMIGLIASMFTAIFFSRTIVDFFVVKMKKQLSVMWGKPA